MLPPTMDTYTKPETESHKNLIERFNNSYSGAFGTRLQQCHIHSSLIHTSTSLRQFIEHLIGSHCIPIFWEKIADLFGSLSWGLFRSSVFLSQFLNLRNGVLVICYGMYSWRTDLRITKDGMLLINLFTLHIQWTALILLFTSWN